MNKENKEKENKWVLDSALRITNDKNGKAVRIEEFDVNMKKENKEKERRK